MSGLRLFKTINFPLKKPPLMDDVIYLGIETNIGTIEHIVSKFAGRAQAVRESKEFTAEGQTKALARMAAEADEELNAFYAKPTTGYTARLKLAEEAMRPQPVSRSDMSVLREDLQHKEIRDYVATLKDPIDVDTFYRRAVNDGNDTVADAIERDPTGRLKFANPHIVEELKFERARRRNPEAAAQWRDFNFALTELKSALAYGRRALRESGLSLPSTDPLHGVGDAA